MREMDLQNRSQYQFTRNWFLNRNLDTFRKFIYPEWQGKPITYLEIGVFEGMSLTWMLQHVLTHPESKAVGIDPWLMTTKLDSDVMTKVMVRAYQNTLQWQQENRCTLVQGSSAEVLRRMVAKGHVGIKCDSVDLCMIDGNHNDYAAYDDAKQCLDLIKPGGWMLFDDVENQVNKKEHVKQGLEMFVKDYGSRVEFLWKDKYMECYKVL